MRAKSDWVVYIDQHDGHEESGMIQFAEWYGPYTKQQAARLEHRLNEILDDGDTEHLRASAMPIERLTPKEAIEKAQSHRAAQISGSA